MLMLPARKRPTSNIYLSVISISSLRTKNSRNSSASRSRRDRNAEAIAQEVDALLAVDPKTADLLLAAKKALGLVPADDDEHIPF